MMRIPRRWSERIQSRYIVWPPLLLIGFLAGLFLLVAAEQSRLESANEQVRDSQRRAQSLSEFVGLMIGTETARRGYLLTGDPAYLRPYRIRAIDIQSALDRVRAAYGDSGGAAQQINQLRRLTDRQLAQLEATPAVAKRDRLARIENIERIAAGKPTMDAIMAIVGAMQLRETASLSAATQRWRADLRWSHRFTAAGAVLNIALVLMAIRLVRGDLRRRTRRAADLLHQKLSLERQVEERTHDLTALSTHLQGVSEQEKSALSRELHDELGGLLVAARMDLSWLQQRLPTSDPGIEQRFRRIHESLSAGVDLKRRVVEELRPTLLDNMGLFAALRWQFKETCRRSGLQCTETIPAEEPHFDPAAAIGLFRIAQEALTNVLKHAAAKSAHMAVAVDADRFILRITDDGKGIAAERMRTIGSHGLASMRHRVTALGGTWDLHCPESGGTIVTASFPLARLLLAEPA